MNHVRFGPHLRQPDPFSCGAASVVVARMLLDPAYADRTETRFADEVVRLHARLVRGTWLSRLGTPPWAVAWALEAITGTRHSVRRAHWESLLDADLPAALLVGESEVPRHWVLVVEVDAGTVTVYDPASGDLRRADSEQFEAEDLDVLGRWRKPLWLVSGTRA